MPPRTQSVLVPRIRNRSDWGQGAPQEALAIQPSKILRYPLDKVDVTGISNEPWHYRYVGKRAADEIYQTGEALEEYLARTR